MYIDMRDYIGHLRFFISAPSRGSAAGLGPLERYAQEPGWMAALIGVPTHGVIL